MVAAQRVLQQLRVRLRTLVFHDYPPDQVLPHAHVLPPLLLPAPLLPSQTLLLLVRDQVVLRTQERPVSDLQLDVLDGGGGLDAGVVDGGTGVSEVVGRTGQTVERTGEVVVLGATFALAGQHQFLLESLKSLMVHVCRHQFWQVVLLYHEPYHQLIELLYRLCVFYQLLVGRPCDAFTVHLCPEIRLLLD